ncbi:MAG: hypothetical protein Q9166_000337 [cf. Caloplaca sp. 2 TL-2023]
MSGSSPQEALQEPPSETSKKKDPWRIPTEEDRLRWQKLKERHENYPIQPHDEIKDATKGLVDPAMENWQRGTSWKDAVMKVSFQPSTYDDRKASPPPNDPDPSKLSKEEDLDYDPEFTHDGIPYRDLRPYAQFQTANKMFGRSTTITSIQEWAKLSEEEKQEKLKVSKEEWAAYSANFNSSS